MKTCIRVLSFFLFCFSNVQCQGQTNESGVLLESTELVGILDSISHPKIVEEVEGSRKWTKRFSYADSIQVNQITYLSDGLKIKGFIVKPKKEGIYPCIIFNRGGNRDFGSLKLIQCIGMLGKIAKEGYVVIASNYRGSSGSEGKDEFGGDDINDVLNLFPIIKEIKGADNSKIGMFGGSRGGMMTYLALTKTNKIKAAAVLAAPSDKFATIEDRPSMENVLVELVDGYEQNKNFELTRRSAIKWADKFPKDVPILMMHGNSDWRVKSTQSLRLALEFDKYRIPYRLMIFEGGDHGLFEYRTEFYSQLTSWFDRYLKNNEALPNMEFHGK